MSSLPDDKLRVVMQAWEGLARFEQDQDKRIKYSDWIMQYGGLKRIDVVELQRRYVEQSSYRKELRMMTNIFKEIGKEEGIAIGHEQGKAEGKISLLMDLFCGGVIDATKACELLEGFAARGEAPRAMIDDALKQIESKKG